VVLTESKINRIRALVDHMTQRARRTAYSSGRREVVGVERKIFHPFAAPSRKVKNKIQGVLDRTAFKFKSWRKF
jgi:hypothetical protein